MKNLIESAKTTFEKAKFENAWDIVINVNNINYCKVININNVMQFAFLNKNGHEIIIFDHKGNAIVYPVPTGLSTEQLNFWQKLPEIWLPK